MVGVSVGITGLGEATAGEAMPAGAGAGETAVRGSRAAREGGTSPEQEGRVRVVGRLREKGW